MGCRQAQVLFVGLCASWRSFLACACPHNPLLTWEHSSALLSGPQHARSLPVWKSLRALTSSCSTMRLHSTQPVLSAAVQVDIYAAGVVL